MSDERDITQAFEQPAADQPIEAGGDQPVDAGPGAEVEIETTEMPVVPPEDSEPVAAVEDDPEPAELVVDDAEPAMVEPSTEVPQAEETPTGEAGAISEAEANAAAASETEPPLTEQANAEATLVAPVTVPDALPQVTPVESQPKQPRPAASNRDRTGKVRTSRGTVRPTRKARLRVARLDLWSVMKTALMFSLAAGVALFVAISMLWGVVEASGALEMVQETLNALLGNPDGSGQVQVSSYIDRWRVLGFTAVVSAANVVLLTALTTLGALLYNLSSSVLGGLEVTLAED